MAAYISVPRDLTKVKSKVAFNLTKRQLVCFGTAALIGVPLFFVLRDSGGNTAATLGMMAVMLPAFFLGMYEKNGQPMEKLLSYYVQSRFVRPKIRPYKTNNYYALLTAHSRRWTMCRACMRRNLPLMGDSIKAAEARLTEIAVLKTHIINYAKTREVYAAYRKAGYSKTFLEAHREEITLHKAAKAAFDEAEMQKLPKVKELDAEFAELLTKKKAAYPDYRKARNEMQELVRAQKNVERFFAEEKDTTEKTRTR